MGRLRFPSFPLHPVMFLVWNTWMGNMFAWSLLAGWLIKIVVTKYGGHVIYQKVKPLMFGFIAGEIFGALVPVIIGALYYFITGDIPKNFSVFPL